MLECRYNPAIRKLQKSKKDGKQVISIMTWRNEDIPKRKYVSQSEYQTVETVDPKEIGVFPGILCWGKEKVEPEEELISLQLTSQSANDFSDHPLGWAEAQTRTGVWQAAPHLDWDCLDGHTPGLLFKL